MKFFITMVEKPDNPYYFCMESVKNQKIMEEKDYFMSIDGQGYSDYLYLTSLHGQSGVRIMWSAFVARGGVGHLVANGRARGALRPARGLRVHQKHPALQPDPEARPCGGGEERAEVSEVINPKTLLDSLRTPASL